MLKGVNKKIIEINNIEGGYFEKVLFFVSDERKTEPDYVLNDKAEKYVNASCSLKYKKSIFPDTKTGNLFKMAISAVIGFALGLIFL